MVEKVKHSREEINSLLRDGRRVYKRNDRRKFMQVLPKHGINDEDPRFPDVSLQGSY
jgi:hypothetical protein